MKIKKLACFAATLAVVGAGVYMFGALSSSTVGSMSEPQTAKGLIPTVRAKVAHRPIQGMTAEEYLSALPTNQTASVRGTKPYVLKSGEKFQKSLRVAAESHGARTIGVLSRHALLIEADPAARKRLVADRRFSGADEFLPERKVSRELADLIVAGAETVEATVVTLTPDDRQRVSADVVALGGEILRGCLNDRDVFSVRLPADCVAELAARGDVQWMEKFDRPHLMNDLAVEPATMFVREAWDVHGLSGEGQILSTSDSGIDSGNLEDGSMHADLADRVVGIKVVEGCSEKDVNGHGTHTAGSIVGNGTKSDGKIRGVAWGARLYAWFCGAGGGSISTPSSYDDLFRPDWENYPTYIHSASWGSDTSGQYNTRCSAIDAWVWANPDFLPVYSAGNAGPGKTTIGSPGAAKNVLSVGATQNLRKDHDATRPNGDPRQMTSFSSRGPCADGRTKPDIVAPGAGILSTRSHGVNYSYGTYGEWYAYDSGTSMSCPLTAGAVALVRQWLVEERGYDDHDDPEAEEGTTPTAALMKAVITGGAKDAPTPNNDQGWGRVDLTETLYPSNGCAVALIDRLPFAEGETFGWIVETTNAMPLSVQLAWVDYAGSAAAKQSEVKLINDLDLVVEPLDGEDADKIYFGNGGEAEDTLNNMESVRLEAAAPGRYRVTVNCSTILHDFEEGGAAALYVRGAFDPDTIVKAPGRIRVVRTTGEEAEYSLLDRALAEVQEGDRIEIREAVKMRKSVELPANCLVVSTNDDPTVTSVDFRAGASIIVPDGVTLTLTNVVFAGASEPLVRVETNGCVVLRAATGLDAGDLAAIETMVSTGFVLDGPLTKGLTLRCVEIPSTNALGKAFGRYTCDAGTAVAAASLIVSADDPDRETRGVAEDGLFKWTFIPEAPLGDAAGSFDRDGETKAYARLNRVFERYLAAVAEGATIPEIDIRKSDSCTNALKITRPLTIRGAKVGLTVRPSDTARLWVGEGGSLVLTNITFRGYRGKGGLFAVEGGDMTLEDGAKLEDLQSAGNSNPNLGGAVSVFGGSLTMKSGSAISKCGTDIGYGGGVLLAAFCEPTSTLNLLGGQIVDCSAGIGGGVYADEGTVVNVEGDVVVRGNVSGNYGKDVDDIDLYDSSCAFTLTGPLTSVGSAIGVRYEEETDDFGNTEGLSFVRVDESLRGLPELEDSAKRFFCDALPSLRGVPAEDGETLVWLDMNGQCDPADARALLIYPDSGETNYYERTQVALAAVTNTAVVVMLKDDELKETVSIWRDVTLCSAPSETRVLTRISTGDAAKSPYVANNCLQVEKTGSLTLTNVVLNGEGSAGDPYNMGRLIYVEGGSLTMEADSAVTGVFCAWRGESAIEVGEGGEFTMKSGAAIRDCKNYDKQKEEGEENVSGLSSSGLRLDNGTAFLLGGTIENCAENDIGGMFVSDISTVFFAGDARIDAMWAYEREGRDSVILADDFTGSVLFMESDPWGLAENTDVFGVVDAAYAASASPDRLAGGAAKFVNAADSGRGSAVTNETAALLVWENALETDEQGRRYYEDEYGNRYDEVVGAPGPVPTEIDPPTAVTGLVYNGNEQTGVVVSVGFTLTGNVGTNAGPYTAKATLDEGYVWAGGSTDAKEISWEIGLATYDMSGASFDDAEYVEDGTPKSIYVSGTLPAGVDVAYEGNGQRVPGTYTVTAKFTGDGLNYNTLTNWTAHLTITAKEDPQEYTVKTNAPTRIAFREITRVSDTTWRIVVTDLVEQAEYAVSSTPDLTTAFTTDTWFRATSGGAWTNTVEKTEPAYFWRVHGRTTYETNWIEKSK